MGSMSVFPRNYYVDIYSQLAYQYQDADALELLENRNEIFPMYTGAKGLTV